MNIHIDFSGRVARLQARLKAAGLAGYVATRQASLSWLMGSFAPWRTAVVVPAEGRMRALYWRFDAERLRTEAWIPDTEEWGHDGDSFAGAVARMLQGMGLASEQVGLDLGSPISQQLAPGLLLAAELMALQEALPRVRWVNAVPLVEELLSVKEPAEVALLRQAAAIADIGAAAAMAAARPGVTENAVAGEVERAIRLAGSEWSWSTTQGTEVGSGHRTAFRAGVTQPATEKLLQHGELVIVDLHPMYRLYLADLAVNSFLGARPPSAIQKLADCWERTVAEYLSLLRPGAVIAEVVEKAFAVIEEAGFGQFGLRAFGHGLGTCARTPPYMAPGNRGVLQENMVLAAGTHIYQPGVGGIRLELPVLITATGCEPLCKWVPRLRCVHG